MVRCLSGGNRLFGPEGGLWGAALNMQSFPSPTESARGYRGDGDMDCLYRHGADRSLKLDRRVFHTVHL